MRYKLQYGKDDISEYWVVFDTKSERVTSAKYINKYMAQTELDHLQVLEDKRLGVHNE